MPDPIDLTGTMRGLADVIALSPDNFDPVTGDARNMSGRSRGGNDFMTGASSMAVSPAYNTFMGDAILMTDDSRGGNDRLICGSNAVNIIYGDAETLTGRAMAATTCSRALQLRRSVSWGSAVTATIWPVSRAAETTG